MKSKIIYSILGLLFSISIIAQEDADIPNKDQVISNDLIVQGSFAVGTDAVNNENFGFNTIVLKENNLRIKFWDTSNSGSFPSTDWSLVANESANGGQNYFAITDDDHGTRPFTVMGGAPNYSLFVSSAGRLGLGTTNPATKIHAASGDTPTLRLDQDGSSGWPAQSWDIAGNESNFFVRDVTNGGQLPFRIYPGAPTNSLYINNIGNIGLGTSTPDGLFDVAHPNNANNHALLIAPNGYLGINIDNGYMPQSQLHVIDNFDGATKLEITNTNSGASSKANFKIVSDNTITLLSSHAVNSSAAKYGVSLGGATELLAIKSTGLILGTNQDDVPIVFGSAGVERMRINSGGNVGIGTTNPQSKLAVNGKITCQEVEVTLVGWPDYVFAKDYKLRSLSEVETFINENNHLPDVPSEQEVLKEGVNIGEMNAILLKKIEELTLYMIDLKKENEEIKSQLKELEK